ncbi:MAG: phage holin family protein [Flavobacteriaceae bacterium]|nr:phage holin family protein [Flavobacteriaceae bacterium]
MNFILRMLLSAAAVLLIANFLTGVHVDNYTVAIIVALVLGFLFAFLKPLLVILTLPITIVTLGFFLLVINTIIILLANKLVTGFSVDGFWWAMLFSILLSIVQSFLHSLIKEK